MRGDGRVWKPPGTQFYHMKVSVDGQVIVQSTGKTTEDEAERFKTKLLQTYARGQPSRTRSGFASVTFGNCSSTTTN
jgi:hypothetical protein